MTDKKLIDLEIKKAFEVLDSWQQVALQNDDGTDTESPKLYEAIEIVRGQINRLQAENESLQRQLQNSKLHQKETHKALQDEKGLRLNEEFIKAEAYKECMEQLDAEIESSNKYIREYDDSELQKAYNKGLRNALKALKGLVGEDNAE